MMKWLLLYNLAFNVPVLHWIQVNFTVFWSLFSLCIYFISEYHGMVSGLVVLPINALKAPRRMQGSSISFIYLPSRVWDIEIVETHEIYKLKTLDSLLDIFKPQAFHLWKRGNNTSQVGCKIIWNNLCKQMQSSQ